MGITRKLNQSSTINFELDQSTTIDAQLPDVIEQTSPYANIVATSLDLLVPLKYASTAADGQILFEDALCTVPVEDGDPVGGVKWDGTIVATQTTDADRPVWQEGVGLVLDGESAHLELIGYESDPDALTWFWAVQLDGSADNTGKNRQIIAHRDTTRPYFQAATREEDTMRAQWGDSANFGPTINVVTDVTQPTVGAFRWDDDGSTQSGKLWVGETTATGTSSFSGGDFASSETFLFCRYGTENFFAGTATAIVIFERALSDADVETMIDELQNLQGS